MKIWLLECEVDKYKGYHLENECDLETIENSFDKGVIINKWSPLIIKSLDDKTMIGDNPKFWPYVNLLMVSERLKNSMLERYKDYIQFLPVVDKNTDNTYYLANIMNFIDGIDNNRSEFKKLLEVYVVDVIKYVLKDNVKDIPIFRLYLQGVLMKTKIFVNDEFKNFIEANNYIGFEFTEVYDFE